MENLNQPDFWAAPYDINDAAHEYADSAVIHHHEAREIVTRSTSEDEHLAFDQWKDCGGLEKIESMNDLLQALSKAKGGEVINISGSATLNIGKHANLIIPGSVTIASDRNLNGMAIPIESIGFYECICFTKNDSIA